MYSGYCPNNSFCNCVFTFLEFFKIFFTFNDDQRDTITIATAKRIVKQKVYKLERFNAINMAITDNNKAINAIEKEIIKVPELERKSLFDWSN